MVALRTEEERGTGKGARSRGRVSDPRVRAVEALPLISIFRPPGVGRVLPLVRTDSLPEKSAYVDAGCELAPSCLGCPLPRCQYDEPGSVRRWLLDARDREIALLRQRHQAPVDALARTYGLTRRSIFRILAEQGAPRRATKEAKDEGRTRI